MKHPLAMSDDARYPLGVPINRAPPVRHAIAGRPGWFLDAHGIPRYVETNPPTTTTAPGAA